MEGAALLYRLVLKKGPVLLSTARRNKTELSRNLATFLSLDPVFMGSYKNAFSWYIGVNFIVKFIDATLAHSSMGRKKILHGKVLQVF